MTRNEMLAIAKPILFNTEMVRAILDGHKTVTRRVIKYSCPTNPGNTLDDFIGQSDPQLLVSCSPRQPGDILYVRETWTKLPVSPGNHFHPNGVYYYKADEELRLERFVRNGWRPSIHMPKDAARIFLRVTGVRVERLRPMGFDEFEAEGLTIISGLWDTTARYANLWDSTIKPADLPLYGWELNPWVWVIDFERMEAR